MAFFLQHKLYANHFPCSKHCISAMNILYLMSQNIILIDFFSQNLTKHHCHHSINKMQFKVSAKVTIDKSLYFFFPDGFYTKVINAIKIT